MKYIFTGLVVMMCSAVANAQSGAKEAEIQKMEKHWTMLLEKKDTTALRSIWTEDYLVNNAMGKIVDVEDIIRIIKSGHIFPKVERNIERISFSSNMAVVMGGEIEYGKDGKKTHRRFTNFWVSTPTGWRLLARQATGR